MFGSDSTNTVEESTSAIRKPARDSGTRPVRQRTPMDRMPGDSVTGSSVGMGSVGTGSVGTDSVSTDSVSTDDRPVSPAPVTEPTTPAGWVHVSFTATASLVVGTLAVAATLTGVLALLGFATGVLAVLLALGAIFDVRRSHVTGHGLVIAGIVFGVAAIVLSLLAINGQLSWLSNKTDEITVLHNWLNNHMHWLRRW